ncbi:hypothetical protein LJC16_01210 [Bacteroidales bacterium OttesenSCG-928-C19]|nr:hypothetical protein [Bacteroidales bacterium OttesenSCG-928-C19]
MSEMQGAEQILQSIELKIKKIAVDYQLEKEKNKVILNEQQRLLDVISEQKERINELEEKNRLLRIKNIVEDSSESKNMKLKINELVREIDKCIELLLNN